MSEGDREVLAAVASSAGPIRLGQVSTRLGCSEAEADRRLRILVQSGHLRGSWVDEPWGEIQWELLPRGRRALQDSA